MTLDLTGITPEYHADLERAAEDSDLSMAYWCRLLRFLRGRVVVGVGTGRVVVAHDDNRVLKVPCSGLGVAANVAETQICALGLPFLPTEIAVVDGMQGVVQAAVVPVVRFLNPPTWVLHVDAYQVGVDKNNDLWIYDFGDMTLARASDVVRVHARWREAGEVA